MASDRDRTGAPTAGAISTRRSSRGSSRTTPASSTAARNGWIASPLVGHYDNQLAWKDDNFKKGSVPVGDPPVSFRAAPTYVLERPLDNFIAGRELIAEAIAGTWGHAEASRLGNETSEGALTWNVLRSLQEAGRLDVAAQALAATETRRRARARLLGTAHRARAGRAVAGPRRRAGCVPPRSRLGLDPDRRPLRRRHRHARRRGGHRGVARAVLDARSRPLRRRRAQTGAGQGSPPPHAPDDRVRASAEGRGRAGGRRRARARERVGRSRAVGRPLPRRHRRCRLPPRHLGVALRGARPRRRRPGAAARLPREQELRPPPRVRAARRGRRRRSG